MIKEAESKCKNAEQQLNLKTREIEEIKFVNSEHIKSLIEYEKNLIDIENENKSLKSQYESLKIEHQHQIEK